MKFLAVLFVCVAFACAEDEPSSEEINREDVKEVSELLKNKFNVTFLDDALKLVDKVEKKCPDLESKIESAAEEVGNCIEGIELGSDTFCQLLRKNFGKCTQPIRKIIIACLPEESKGLPILGEKIVAAILDQLCNSTVEQVLELFNPCILEKDIEDIKECEGITASFMEHKNELPSKKLVCDLLPKVQGCAKASVEQSCTNPITKQAHLSYYEAVDEATHEDCAELNKARK